MNQISNAIQNGIDKAMQSFQDKAIDFLIYVLKCIGNFIVETSDITCPIICLLALAFYITGNRKAGKYVSGSIVFYFLAQAIKGIALK
jgi:hypothetical protein